MKPNSIEGDELLVVRSPWLRVVYAIFSRDGFFALLSIALTAIIIWTLVDREKVSTQQAAFNQKMIDLLAIVHEDHQLIVNNQGRIIENEAKVIDIDGKMATSIELLSHIVGRIDERDVRGRR